MTWGSSVPGVVAALTASWTTATGGVDVRNGPVVLDDSTLEGVSVGYQDADSPAAEGEFSTDAYVSDPMREQYTINCLLVVRDGDGDQIAAQARAWAILGLIGGSLAADHSLGGLVLSAHLGTWALTLTQTDVGATARLPFDVVIDAYTTP